MSVLTADRDLTKLTPAMQERVANFLRECERRDCHVFVTEGYRTYPRQLWLYSFGRSGDNKDKGAVTWTMKSKHLDATLSRREVYKLIVESIKRLNQENLL